MSPRAAVLLVFVAVPALARKPSPADAKAFVARVEAELKARDIRASTADWVRETYITDDSDSEAGKRLWAMLSLGASRSSQDALEALTGERRMDAAAMLEYFAPLEG